MQVEGQKGKLCRRVYKGMKIEKRRKTSSLLNVRKLRPRERPGN